MFSNPLTDNWKLSPTNTSNSSTATLSFKISILEGYSGSGVGVTSGLVASGVCVAAGVFSSVLGASVPTGVFSSVLGASVPTGVFSLQATNVKESNKRKNKR